MAHNITRLSLVTAFLLLTGPAALAQTDYSPLEQAPMSQPTSTQPVRWDGAAGFRVECGQDLRRFCNGVQPGEGRLIQCLSSHRSELSSECISRLAARPAFGVRMDCGQDLQRFCNAVQPGEGRLIQCLSSHRNELSSACIARVAAARPVAGGAPTSENTQSPGPPSDSRPPGRAVTESALRASCGPDAQKHCGGISRENGGVIKCLSTHRMELSPTCAAFFNEMPVQRAAQTGAAKAKLPTSHGLAITPAMTNGTDSAGAPPTANGSTTTPSAADGAADSGAPPATNGPTSTPPAANDAADTGAAPATNGPTSTPPAANDAADTGAAPATNGPTSTPPAANDAADTGAAPATNGPTSTPPPANGAADSGAPPATNGAPTTSAPPPAKVLPAKGTLAIPL
jgi:Cysteine rich repeat